MVQFVKKYEKYVRPTAVGTVVVAATPFVAGILESILGFIPSVTLAGTDMPARVTDGMNPKIDSSIPATKGVAATTTVPTAVGLTYFSYFFTNCTILYILLLVILCLSSA